MSIAEISGSEWMPMAVRVDRERVTRQADCLRMLRQGLMSLDDYLVKALRFAPSEVPRVRGKFRRALLGGRKKVSCPAGT